MLSHVRKRTIMIAAFAGAGLAALSVAVASSHSTPSPQDLPVSNLNTPAGRTAALTAKTAYQASGFPISIRVTLPDADWGGTQWKTTTRGKPAFGWVAFARGPVSKPPQGIIELETAYGATPSVETILGRLRSAGGGANFGKTVRTTFSGFPAWQVDGFVYGRFGHVFVPFTPKTGGASPPDSEKLEPKEAFRLIVADVRGKRVVAILDSAALPADQFPSFLSSAAKLLSTLQLPAS
jgi:hypothetical protein